jgi:hypothetical protein
MNKNDDFIFSARAASAEHLLNLYFRAAQRLGAFCALGAQRQHKM